MEKWAKYIIILNKIVDGMYVDDEANFPIKIALFVDFTTVSNNQQ